MSAHHRDSLRLLATTTLAVAVALAAISHVRGVLFGRVGVGPLTLFVRSEYGKLLIDVHKTDWCDLPRWQAATWSHAGPALAPTIGGWWRYGGFSYARGGTAGGITVHQFAIPYWSLAVIGMVAWILTRRWPKFSRAAPPAASGDPSRSTPR